MISARICGAYQPCTAQASSSRSNSSSVGGRLVRRGHGRGGRDHGTGCARGVRHRPRRSNSVHDDADTSTGTCSAQSIASIRVIEPSGRSPKSAMNALERRRGRCPSLEALCSRS